MKRKLLRNITRIMAIFIVLALLGRGLFLLRQADPEAYNMQMFKDYLLSFSSSLPHFIALVILFFVFKVVLRLIRASILKLNNLFIGQSRSKNLLKLVEIAWRFLYVMISFSIIFKNVGALITSLGLVGLGLTFALQKPILNAVGRLTIIGKDIYSEGDRIKVGGVEGDVAQIQLMNTVLHGVLENTDTRNHKMVTIPNELILSSSVENITKGSNYVLEELSISITYESDYHKAIDILEHITKKHLHTIKQHIKKDSNNKEKLFQALELKTGLFGKKERQQQRQEDLSESTDWIIKKNLPKIRIEMADSAILLIVQFVSPYDKVNKNRTDINLAFLDKIREDDSVEVAYPHMELVYKKKKYLDSSL